jgi:hypothetical protein
MKSLSKKEMAMLISPILAGACFIATVFLNHALFRNQIISVRQAIGHEIFVFLIGLFTIILLFAFSVKWLFKKQWGMVLLCIVGITVFWLSVIYGRSQGAAMFYAT